MFRKFVLVNGLRLLPLLRLIVRVRLRETLHGRYLVSKV